MFLTPVTGRRFRYGSSGVNCEVANRSGVVDDGYALPSPLVNGMSQATFQRCDIEVTAV